MSGHSSGDNRSVAGKIVAIMCAFTRETELSNIQIARRVGLPNSTAHRLLHDLVAGGLLERTDRGHYRVGPKILAMAAGGAPSAAGVSPE